MCGITGIIALSEKGKASLEQVEGSVRCLQRRGPDDHGTYRNGHLALGHARLSVIDTSNNAAQPFTTANGRYTIVFNGEIYNYRELRKELEGKQIAFVSQSDTEVLLHLFIQEGPECLEKLNGFFAFAIYDKEEDLLFIARDRMGIKPLLWYRDGDHLLFGFEMKALLAYDIPRELDNTSLFTYLQLNYIPAPHTIFSGVRKLLPGHCLLVRSVQKAPSVEERQYYGIPFSEDKVIQATPSSYREAQKKLHRLLEDAVQQRLVADVPLGTFLSGGIDSSVITALAARHKAHLNTFSIGYRDEPFFDETRYARLVARKCRTEHTVFSLTNDDLFANLHDVLDYIDEPFADSSAIAVNILSRYTRQQVTVVLSGDGADELFSGYNKHFAEFKARNPGVGEQMIKGLAPLFERLPQSRNSKLGNLNRQLARFATGMKLSPKERYWRWASFQNEEQANYLLREERKVKYQRLSDEAYNYKKRKDELLRHIRKDGTLNDVLYTDTQLVLPNDMLTKVDLMSMAHGLEVRTPFLDYRVAEYAFTLPVSFKINASMKKKILQDTFREELPEELYNRPKQGFEVPLLKWFQTELRSVITDDLLEKDFIHDQGIFNPQAVEDLKIRLFSGNPGDTHATVWALLVFQHWWRKYMNG